MQVLIEAAVLTALAGFAGVVTGLVATRSIGAVLGWQTLVSGLSLVVAFLLAVAVGLFFGYYPARRAARHDPITAMQTV